MKNKIIWISWEKHRRTRGICDYFNIELFEIISRQGRLVKYFSLTLRTLLVLAQQHPSVLIVQNPSLVLSLFAVFMRILFRYRLVVDAHNEAVEPYINNNLVIRFISDMIIRLADITIVTNPFLLEKVEQKRGKGFVLPDRLPIVNTSDIVKTKLSDNINLVLICTYAEDEPVFEIFEAASHFHSSVNLYVTGDYKIINREIREALSKNIVFTGYLSEPKYWSLLYSADGIIDLSRMDNCLVCGAYEAVALKKPLILSDNNAIKDYFRKGVIYADSDTESIKTAISEFHSIHDSLNIDIDGLNSILIEEWNVSARKLRGILNNSPC